MKTREKMIGDALKEVIGKSHITQKTLAKSAKISETTLSRALNGKQGLQPANLSAILEVLGQSMPDLLKPMFEAEMSSNSIAEYVKGLESKIEDLTKSNSALNSKIKSLLDERLELGLEALQAREFIANKKLQSEYNTYLKDTSPPPVQSQKSKRSRGSSSNIA